jgi:hypothetical protein
MGEKIVAHYTVVLSLSVRWMDQWTADGRVDRRTGGYPLLSGVHGVKKTSILKDRSTICL